MNPSPKWLTRTRTDPLGRIVSKTWRKRKPLARNLPLENRNKLQLMTMIIKTLECLKRERLSTKFNTLTEMTPQKKIGVPEEGLSTKRKEEKPKVIPPRISFQTSRDHTFSSWKTNLASRRQIPSKLCKSSRKKMGSRCMTTKLYIKCLSFRRHLRSSSRQDTSTGSWCLQEVLWRPE